MKTRFHSTRLPFILTFIVALLIGYFLAADYGESWDEIYIYRYGDYAINAYQFILRPQNLPDFDTNLNLYGPAYFIAAVSLSRLFVALIPAWSIVVAMHFTYFLTYAVGVLTLYFLAQRWMSELAALGAALLFAFQPLLWGHAFINPKDTPFMTFFMLSVYLGLQMLDASAKSKWRAVLAAGIILGFTTSIRSLGPMAGALVILFGLWKSPRKTTSIAPLYFLVAGITTYLTWPYLWKAPIAHFIESLKTMSSFPDTGSVLFMRNLYPANQLPLRYFPTFLSLQLTEPAALLIVIGAALSFKLFIKDALPYKIRIERRRARINAEKTIKNPRSRRKSASHFEMYGREIKDKNREPLLLFAGWFLAPTLWIVFSGSTLYDNARQLLFLLPPLFILAGVGIDALLTRIKTAQVKAALLALIILPGIYACVQLHPYEYVYYNSLIGGVGGAYRKFDLDYWGVSYKEAMEYINKNAEPGAQIVVVGHPPLARLYAREDLAVMGSHKVRKSGIEYYYVIFLTRNNADEDRCVDAETVYTIERDGGVLSYIKKVKPEQRCK